MADPCAGDVALFYQPLQPGQHGERGGRADHEAVRNFRRTNGGRLFCLPDHLHDFHDSRRFVHRSFRTPCGADRHGRRHGNVLRVHRNGRLGIHRGEPDLALTGVGPLADGSGNRATPSGQRPCGLELVSRSGTGAGERPDHGRRAARLRRGASPVRPPD